MTVCIAAIHRPSGAIVTVSDMMLADDYVSRERGVVKFFPLTQSPRWYCLYSDSSSAVSPVQRHAFILLSAVESPDIDDVKLAVERAYQIEIERQIERDVLGPLAMSREEFKDEGLRKLGPEIFARKVVEIESVKLPLQLLVFGFDEGTGDGKMSRLFSVNEQGRSSEHDVEGVFAIGTGSWAALGSIYAKPWFPYVDDVEEAIYDVCEAKFASETSRYVGQETVAFVVFPDGREMYLSIYEFDKLRVLWKRRTKRVVPEAARKIISEGLKPW
jgi:hypothetical protein